MTKGQLLEMLKNVNDDQELNIVSSNYDENDDMTWSPDYHTDIQEVKVGDVEDVYIVLEAREFM